MHFVLVPVNIEANSSNWSLKSKIINILKNMNKVEPIDFRGSLKISLGFSVEIT